MTDREQAERNHAPAGPAVAGCVDDAGVGVIFRLFCDNQRRRRPVNGDTDREVPSFAARGRLSLLRPGALMVDRLNNAGEGCDRLSPRSWSAVVVGIVEQDHIAATQTPSRVCSD